MATDNLPQMRYSARQVGDVLGQYYGGMSLKELRRQFDQQYHLDLSRSTFDRWRDRFSKIAIDEVNKQKLKIGDVWIADETVLKIGGSNIWVWDIIDRDTRYLLATHISRTRMTKDAKELMEKASKVAGKPPKVVITDSLRSYIDGIELAFGGETRHIQSNPFAEENDTNLIERFHSTLKTRTEIMRGLKSLETAQTLLDGWIVHYNYFRPHESLDNHTPSEVAQAKYPFKDWLEVVESQSPKPRKEGNSIRIETINIVPKVKPHKARKPKIKRVYRRRVVPMIQRIG
ncbi:MAG: DDE-type integrase/transposase/recombinase [Dehalococcoidales bacterium]|nr:DDE-type integrase/transposase/recombinase [Dehalococcoidales bacterium]